MRSGIFEVKSFYKELHAGPGSLFPWKSIWKVNVLPKSSVFTWTLALGQILTLDNLWRRRMLVVDLCYMCKKAKESWSFITWLWPCGSCGLWSLVNLRFNGSCLIEFLSCWNRRFSRHGPGAHWILFDGSKVDYAIFLIGWQCYQLITLLLFLTS